MPATRRLARELKVDLNLVQATGNNGRITDDDVKAFANKSKNVGGPEKVASANRFRIVTRFFQIWLYRTYPIAITSSQNSREYDIKLDADSSSKLIATRLSDGTRSN